jgi:hypothetical protein
VSDIINYKAVSAFLQALRDTNPCQHCRDGAPHFHEDGTGHVGGLVIGLYHQTWGPLTDHDEELPGYEYSLRGRREVTA